jgi:hypothetical protein
MFFYYIVSYEIHRRQNGTIGWNATRQKLQELRQILGGHLPLFVAHFTENGLNFAGTQDIGSTNVV